MIIDQDRLANYFKASLLEQNPPLLSRLGQNRLGSDDLAWGKKRVNNLLDLRKPSQKAELVLIMVKLTNKKPSCSCHGKSFVISS